MQVYKSCMVHTLLYASKTWTPHAYQEVRLYVFHMFCLIYTQQLLEGQGLQQGGPWQSWGPIHGHTPETGTFVCSAMCATWRMVKFPRTSYLVSLHQEKVHQGIHSYTSRMCAGETWRQLTLTPTHGKPLHKLEADGKEWSHLLWREAVAPWWRETGPQKGQMPVRQASYSLYLWTMPKRLSVQCGTI